MIMVYKFAATCDQAVVANVYPCADVEFSSLAYENSISNFN